MADSRPVGHDPVRLNPTNQNDRPRGDLRTRDAKYFRANCSDRGLTVRKKSKIKINFTSSVAYKNSPRVDRPPTTAALLACHNPNRVHTLKPCGVAKTQEDSCCGGGCARAALCAYERCPFIRRRTYTKYYE